MKIHAMVAIGRAMVWSGARIKQAGTSLSRVPSFNIGSHTGSHAEMPGDRDTRAGGLPFTHNPNNSGPMSPVGRHGGFNPNMYDSRTAIGRPMSTDGHSEYSGTTEVASQISPARQRLQHAVRSVIRMQGALPSAFNPPGKKSGTNNGDGGDDDSTKKELQLDIARSARVGSLVPKLKQMEPVRDLVGHAALVKHLQFSPDGQLLATSSWDRTSLICEYFFELVVPCPLITYLSVRVGDPEPHRVLAHPQGFVGQVAWSPDGRYLLTKLTRAIKIWTEVCSLRAIAQ